MKLTDKIELLRKEDDEHKEMALEKNPEYVHKPRTFYSYEYFPPKTAAGKLNFKFSISLSKTF